MTKLAKFANILFAGPCNAACPDCIGKQVRNDLSPNNLDVFPLKNLDLFTQTLKEELITELSFTGTTTDPLMFKHQGKLIQHFREQIPNIRISLHTNGRLIKKLKDIYNSYDRAAISIPSFEEITYKRIMGTKHVPDLKKILEISNIPIKLSVLIDDDNKNIIPYLEQCSKLGVKRVVFRRMFGETRLLSEVLNLEYTDLIKTGSFMNNPVYDYKGIQVTLREYESTQNLVYNLFADGTIYNGYLITEA